MWRKNGRDSYNAHNLPETSLSQHYSQYVTLRLQSIFNLSWWRGSITPASSSSGIGRRRQEEAGICRRRSSTAAMASLGVSALSFTAKCSHWQSLETSFQKSLISWNFSAFGEQVYLAQQQPMFPYILLGAGLAQTPCLNKLKPKQENQPWWLKIVLIIPSPAFWS